MEDRENLLPARPVRESQSEMIEIVLPNDANPLGALLGGRLMHWIDIAGALAAHRHSRSYVVTASIDHLDFLVPVHVGFVKSSQPTFQPGEMDLDLLLDGARRLASASFFRHKHLHELTPTREPCGQLAPLRIGQRPWGARENRLGKLG